jgi:hypothetical protein
VPLSLDSVCHHIDGPSQDLIARFTLDSSSEFLFGFNIDSLGAGLRYPDSSPLANSPEFVNHPSNVFVEAFSNGLQLIANRARMGNAWRFAEFWEDKVKIKRDILDKIMQPYIETEFAKKREGKNEDKNEEGKTLLSSLVQYTEGNAFAYGGVSFFSVMPFRSTRCWR